jgi:DNA invertase Pin-like site-specific DNA recombinase
MIVGYARTSTTDQTAGLEGQERDLRAAGAERVFTEQVSSIAQRAGLCGRPGMKFLRPTWQRGTPDTFAALPVLALLLAGTSWRIGAGAAR